MKKVALLHYAYPPNIGGVERLIFEQAHILSDIGFDVAVLTGSGKEEDQRIKLIEDSEFQSVLSFDPDLQRKIVAEGTIDEDFYRLAQSIEEKLGKYLYDREVIIVHNMLTLVHNLPFIHAFKKFAAGNLQKKIIVWAHDQTFIDEGRILDKKEGISLSDEGHKLLMTPLSSAAYVAISENFKKLLSQVMDYPQDRIKVIPDGVNTRNFLEINDSIWELVRNYNLLKRFPLILSPVNILPRKNIEYCLDIVGLLKEYYPSIAYMISGKPSVHRSTGDHEKYLKEKIASLGLDEQVIYIGKLIDRALFDHEIHDLYDLADAVFYFSKSENFGLPILESCLSKTPIFVSNLNVFREIGGDNLVYIDFTKEDPRAVCGIVRDYLEKNTLIGMNRIVRQNYDLESIIKEKLLPLIE